MKTFRKKLTAKVLSWFCIFSFLHQLFLPMAAYAGGGGPKQPEVQSFTPIGASDVVDPFTGDFQYNIPLMDVGGYPLNIGYHSNIAADQESSWIGLGWNLNPGTVTRDVRGVPDDFDGDEMTEIKSVKPSETLGGALGLTAELFGFKLPTDGPNVAEPRLSGGVGISMGINYNNYNGWGIDIGASYGMAFGVGKSSITADLGLNANSDGVLGVIPRVGLQNKINRTSSENVLDKSISIGLPFNTRQGLQSITVDANTSFRNKGTPGTFSERFAYGGSASMGYSFAGPSYTPRITMPMENVGVSADFATGFEAWGMFFGPSIRGYYSRQSLSTDRKSVPAFGYLNASNETTEGLHDFNREKDGDFSPKQPNLPVPIFTHDIYTVTGQGIGGSYRPFRNDMGHVHDNTVRNTSYSTNLPGVEVGGGVLFRAGTNLTQLITDEYSGDWVQLNNAGKVLQFKDKVDGNPLYEPWHFRRAGEVMPMSDPSFFQKLGGYDPVRITLGNDGIGQNLMVNDRGEQIPLTSDNTKNKREPRNVLFSSMNGYEAPKKAVDRVIYSYAKNDFTMNTAGKYSQRTEVQVSLEGPKARPKHHMSEITITAEDGSRYIYGIPIYNYEQHEVTFAVGNLPADCGTGLVYYAPGDNSTNNEKGLDKYFQQIKTPAYATAWLLTAIISADYIDKTNDGPSDDDKGTYTKFNYTRITDSYKWRMPFEQNAANHSEGLNSLDDDKASYLYGEKELWYLHSIETRNQVAEFTIGDRLDGYGVENENGGFGTVPMQYLQKVTLYNKSERAKEMFPGDNRGFKAVPLKTAIFEYDYTLCPYVPNKKTVQDFFTPGSGKLTLRKLYFTFGLDKKAAETPYLFNYEGVNPGYSMKAYDRWGNYKPNVYPAGNSTAVECEPGERPNAEFPYVLQTKSTADENASAWQLTSIVTPSGCKMTVNYESDDYAFVQDRRAMQMFNITGIADSPNDNPLTKNNDGYHDVNGNNLVLFFKLKTPLNMSRQLAHQFVRDNYARDILSSVKPAKMYFRIFSAIDQGNTFEYVPGYADVLDAGAAMPSGDGLIQYGYIQLGTVNLDKGDNTQVHPFSRATWNFTRLYHPLLAFNPNDEPDPPTDNMVGAMEAIGRAVTAFAAPFSDGVNTNMNQADYGKKIIGNKSVIRLYTPDGFKYGGGTRVKTVRITDAWDKMCPECEAAAAEYGKTYEYTKILDEGGIKKVISSGVASYEPQLGGEENPFRQPIEFTEDGVLAPSERYYQEEPFGESLFPAPVVGYSQVTIRNFNPGNVKKTGSGKEVLEFYTAQDFPTIVRRTTVQQKEFNPSAAGSVLTNASGIGSIEDFLTMSQGYVIELNDMHGKPKSVKVFPEFDENSEESKKEPVSSITYDYKKEPYGEHSKLVNTCDIMVKKPATGSHIIRNVIMGVDVDFVNDMREHEISSKEVGANGNLDGILAAFFSIPIPTVLPKFSTEKVRFRSAVTAKVIHRAGILEKVTRMELGSTSEMVYSLYDAETGEPILTTSHNEFQDPLYTYNFPAYWGYDGMGPAYRNIGAVITKDALDALPDQKHLKYQLLVPGDEVMLLRDGEVAGDANWWVVDVTDTDVLLSDGQSSTRHSYQSLDCDAFKVMRSGRRNISSVSMEQIVSLKPFTVSNGMLRFEKMVHDESVTFSDSWPIECNCGAGGVVASAPNDFATGIRGVWRPLKSYVMMHGRVASVGSAAAAPVVRSDGAYVGIGQAFWVPPGAADIDWNPRPASGWKEASTVTQFNLQGFEQESKNALGIYASTLYGFRGMLPLAVSSNAALDEIYAETFEDKDPVECPDDFSMKKHLQHVTEDESHSGRNSIRVTPGSKLVITKDMECQRIPVIK